MINGRYDLEHERNTEKHSINKGQRTIEWKKGLKYSSPTCFRNKRDSSTDPNASMSYFLFPSSFWREFRIFWIRSSIRYNLDQRNVYIYIYIYIQFQAYFVSDRFVEILMENKRVWNNRSSNSIHSEIEIDWDRFERC